MNRRAFIAGLAGLIPTLAFWRKTEAVPKVLPANHPLRYKDFVNSGKSPMRRIVGYSTGPMRKEGDSFVYDITFHYAKG